MKKLVLFGVLVAMFAGSFVFLYNYFGTDQVQALTLKTSQSQHITFIDYKELKDFTTTNPDVSTYILVDGNQDSEYLLNNLIASIATDNNGTALPNIAVIDLSKETDFTVTRLKSQFGVETYPALIHGTYDQNMNKVNTTSTLVNNTKKPLTEKKVKQWFFDNGLWNGPYNEQ